MTAVVCTCEVPTASVFGDTAHVHEAGRKARCLAYITDARAPIEQAKGILRTCHATTADRAFEMLRDHSQHNGRKLSDVAAAVVESHLLLLPAPPTSSERTD